MVTWLQPEAVRKRQSATTTNLLSELVGFCRFLLCSWWSRPWSSTWMTRKWRPACVWGRVWDVWMLNTTFLSLFRVLCCVVLCVCLSVGVTAWRTRPLSVCSARTNKDTTWAVSQHWARYLFCESSEMSSHQTDLGPNEESNHQCQLSLKKLGWLLSNQPKVKYKHFLIWWVKYLDILLILYIYSCKSNTPQKGCKHHECRSVDINS